MGLIARTLIGLGLTCPLLVASSFLLCNQCACSNEAKKAVLNII